MKLSKALVLKNKISGFLLGEFLPVTKCHLTNIFVVPKELFITEGFIDIIESSDYDQEQAFYTSRKQFKPAESTNLEVTPNYNWDITAAITIEDDFYVNGCFESKNSHLFYCWIGILIQSEKGELLENYNNVLDSI